MIQRSQQGLKKKQSYIKAPANLCDDRMKFIEGLITCLFYSRLEIEFPYRRRFTNVSSLKSDKHMLVISFAVSKRVFLQCLKCQYNKSNVGNKDYKNTMDLSNPESCV